MNYNKIRNWIKICFAFCKFVETNKVSIRSGKVDLEQIILAVYPKTGNKLLQYIEERKEIFKSHDESIDYVEAASGSFGKRTIKEVVTS